MSIEESMTGDEAIANNMRDYGKETLLSYIPNSIDGFKPIQRRIVWTIRGDNNRVPLLDYTGQILRIHPAGDSSINDAAIKLAQPFSNIVPIIQSDANVGDYSGGNSGKPRYVKVWANNVIKDIYFTDINVGTLKYIPSQLGKGVEPKFLVPKLPMALLTGNFGMAVGYTTKMPSMGFTELCNLTIEYTKCIKAKGFLTSSEKSKLGSFLIPDFPVRMTIRNQKQLLHAYANHDYMPKVLLDGHIEVTPTTLTIRTLPHGHAPNIFYQKVLDALKTKDNLLSDAIKEPGNFADFESGISEANIELNFNKGVNPFDVLPELKKLMHYSSSWSPKMRLVDPDGMCRLKNHFDILDTWYNERKRSITSNLKITQSNLIKKHRELCAYIAIDKDKGDYLIKLSRSAEDSNVIIEPLKKFYDLTTYQVNILLGMEIRALTKKSRSDLILERDEVMQKIKDLQTRFLSVPDIIVDDITKIRDRYSKDYPRQATVANFNGVVNIPKHNGAIQYRTDVELNNILSDWGNDLCEVSRYPSGQKHKLLFNKGNIRNEDTSDLSEIENGSLHCQRLKPKYTIGLRPGKWYRYNGLNRVVEKDLDFIYVGDYFTRIDAKGNVERVQTTSIPARNSVSSGGVLNDYSYVSAAFDMEEILVVHNNSNELNTIRFDRIDVSSGKGKIIQSPMGKTTILGIFKPNENITLTIPKSCLKRCNIRHINIAKGVLDNPRVTLDVNRKKANNSTKLIKFGKNSFLYKLVK